ncbi:DNA-binding protein HBsu [Desulfurella amilsii]|uniref:DNA-binding protein HBsu n=1 Tax=Desulfurella amilsii TaxID=1562698 RepID=A0A1X4XZ39_9BACT|nr:HU family DNA-binding protein [Desulfurella amilsii]OSS42773.1 Integration host factor alpha subunit [Desulfurella amilsii]OSS42848.1 DNA-binding protein HBsu [Desulfurella amilsii]
MEEKKSLSKSDVVDELAQKTQFKKADAEKFLSGFIELVEKELKQGKEVNITGFGKFYVSKRAAREGINPQTKEKIKLPESKLPMFKAGTKLKEAVNG